MSDTQTDEGLLEELLDTYASTLQKWTLTKDYAAVIDDEYRVLRGKVLERMTAARKPSKGKTE